MSEAISSFDDAALADLRPGDIITIKGKLEAIRYGGKVEERNKAGEAIRHSDPSLVITFADWTQLAITVWDYATAKGIRIPLSSYVGVKAQVVHEDGDLMALAIWELGQGNVQPIGEAMKLNH